MEMMCCSHPSDDTARPNVRRRRPHTRARCLVGRMRADAINGSRAMTTPSGPGAGQPDPGVEEVMSERRQLINVAYRLLGSLAEAEDAVQETYARWYALTPAQRDAIESPGAWLTTVTSRICLDQLGSARARRPGRPHHARRVGLHGLPGRARIDDPRRTGRFHPARRVRLPLRGDRGH